MSPRARRRLLGLALLLATSALPLLAGAGPGPADDEDRPQHAPDPVDAIAGGRGAAGPAPTSAAMVAELTAYPTRTPGRPWLEGLSLDEVAGERLSLVGIGHCQGVICDDPVTRAKLESLSDLHPGLPLAGELFDRAHTNLLATGYFREVTFRLQRGIAGIDVLIDLQGEVFVERVQIEVAEWFPAVFQSEIRQRLVYRPGRPLNPDPEVRLRQEETIRRLYENKGFEGSEVHISWQIEDFRAEVRVRIREGRGYPLGNVHVRGNKHFSAAEVTQPFAGTLNLSGSSLWGATLLPALPREIREEREAELVRMYGEEGFFEATVRSREARNPDTETIELWIDIEEGVKYQISFQGNQAIPAWELRRRLTFWDSHSVSEQDAGLSAEELRRAYREEGYPFAEVDPRFDPQDATRLEFRIWEGPRAEITSIHIEGNASPEGQETRLKGLLASGESGLLSSRRLLREQLAEDRTRLETFYRDHGYLRFRMLTPRIFFDPARTILYHPPTGAQWLLPASGVAGGGNEEVTAPPGGLVVQRPPDQRDIQLYLTLPVVEGVQTRLRSAIVTGAQARSVRQVLETLGLRAGAPFSPERLAQGANRLRQSYFEAGFPNASVEISCRSEGPTDDCGAGDVVGGVVDVAVRIAEGTQARLGELFVRGNRRTLTTVVENELPMRPGDLFDRSKLNVGQANLRSLGLFRGIRITEIGSSPEAPRSRIALVIELEEREDRFVDFNLTLRSLGVQQKETTLLWGVEARYRDLNLLGRGLQLSLPFIFGNEKTAWEPSLLWPRPLRLKLPTTWSLFVTAENDLRESVEVLPVDSDFLAFFNAPSLFDNYNRFRFGTGLSVLIEDLWGLRVTPEVKVQRQGERRQLEQQLCLTGQGTRGTCIDFDNLIRLSVPLLYARRDNPLHPTRGWSAAFQADYALKLILGEAKEAETQYSRLQLMLQGYRPLLDRRLVLAGLLRAGWVIPWTGPTEEIPTDDLFFLGGDGNLRGFAEKSVGPRDRQGVPLGERTRLLGTAELRIHLAWWLWGALFYDTGLLVPEPQDVRLTALRHSAGLGLRILLLELMPLRFDLARVLDQEPEDQTTVFTFNLGYTF